MRETRTRRERAIILTKSIKINNRQIKIIPLKLNEQISRLL